MGLWLTLIVEVVGLCLLGRAIEAALVRLVPVRTAYYLFVAPGTVVHELSHLLVCYLTLARPQKVRLFWPDPTTGTLGFVEYRLPKKAHFRRALIALAPLAGGTLALWVLLKLFVPGFTLPAYSEGGGLLELGARLLASLSPAAQAGPGVGWRLALFAFFMLSLGATVAPSWQDLKLAGWGVLLAAVVIVLSIGLVGLAARIGWPVPTGWLVGLGQKAVSLWGLAVVAALLSLLGLGVLAILRLSVRALLGRPLVAVLIGCSALGAFGALAGCAGTDSTALSCRADSDCPAGLRCQAGTGVCIGFTTPLDPVDAGAPPADATADRPADGPPADVRPDAPGGSDVRPDAAPDVAPDQAPPDAGPDTGPDADAPSDGSPADVAPSDGSLPG